MFRSTSTESLTELTCALQDVLAQTEPMAECGDFDGDLHVTLSQFAVKVEHELDRRNEHRISEHHRLSFRRWKKALP